jgi:hypothetical protein
VRRVAATVTDALLSALLAYLGFRLALWGTPCSDTASCFPLAPTVVACVLLGAGVYFGAGYRLWKSTPGQRLFAVEVRSNEDEQ